MYYLFTNAMQTINLYNKRLLHHIFKKLSYTISCLIDIIKVATLEQDKTEFVVDADGYSADQINIESSITKKDKQVQVKPWTEKIKLFWNLN